MERLVRVNEAAQELGLKEATLRSWILHRKIAFVKLGRAVRIPSTEIEKLIAENMIPAKPEGRR